MVDSLLSILGFVCVVYFNRVNDKFCPSFYSQDLLSFDSLSRDCILNLDPNDNSRKVLHHNSSSVSSVILCMHVYLLASACVLCVFSVVVLIG
jgi:hypothetical protein